MLNYTDVSITKNLISVFFVINAFLFVNFDKYYLSQAIPNNVIKDINNTFLVSYKNFTKTRNNISINKPENYSVTRNFIKKYFNLSDNTELFMKNSNEDFEKTISKMRNTGDMCETQYETKDYYKCNCLTTQTHYFSINSKIMNISVIGFVRNCNKK
mgnify:CR=1 FL=1